MLGAFRPRETVYAELVLWLYLYVFAREIFFTMYVNI